MKEQAKKEEKKEEKEKEAKEEVKEESKGEKKEPAKEEKKEEEKKETAKEEKPQEGQEKQKEEEKSNLLQYRDNLISTIEGNVMDFEHVDIEYCTIFILLPLITVFSIQSFQKNTNTNKGLSPYMYRFGYAREPLHLKEKKQLTNCR